MGASLVVKDYGIGIIVDHQRRIFEGFFTTQETAVYSSKKPFDFNAGGRGADLLRMKIFSERYRFSIRHGKYMYQLKKSKELNTYEIEVFLDGNRIHGYSINEDARNFSFFYKTIKKSFDPGNTFMSCICITQVFEDRTLELKDNTLICYKGAKSDSKMLKNMDEVEAAVKNDLMMPRCPIKKAIDIFEQMAQHSFFEYKKYPEAY